LTVAQIACACGFAFFSYKLFVSLPRLRRLEMA
jgi:hypothetical protein